MSLWQQSCGFQLPTLLWTGLPEELERRHEGSSYEARCPLLSPKPGVSVSRSTDSCHPGLTRVDLRCLSSGGKKRRKIPWKEGQRDTDPWAGLYPVPDLMSIWELRNKGVGPRAEGTPFIRDSLSCWAQEGLRFLQPYSALALQSLEWPLMENDSSQKRKGNLLGNC